MNNKTNKHQLINEIKQLIKQLIKHNEIMNNKTINKQLINN